MSALDPFYPIVDSAAWVGRLVDVGARFIQLRIKDATEDHLRSEMHHALTICRRSGAELVVNDHWQIAIDSGAAWVHLGQGDLDDADILAVRKAGIRLGISTHDDAELVRALTFAPDYVALGPIYPTKLKAMAFAPQGLETIGVWKRRIGAIPLVAIGGLTVERAKLCLAAGADIVSVVTDITLNADPEQRARMDSGDTGGVTQRLPIALTIAGSDSGGGAGIQADLKTFAAFGVYAASVVTALTAQNTRGVRAIHTPPPGIVGAQIEAVLEDFAVAAIKIGMLGSAEIANVVAARLPSPLGRGVGGEGARTDPHPADYVGHLLPAGEGRQAFIVYDPVLIASSGDALSGSGFVDGIRHALLPLVDCLTPNLAEAATLLREPIAKSEADMERQGAALLKLGPRAILMKGGHLEAEEAIDLLVTEDNVSRFAAPRLASKNLHGTGCTLSSAVAASIVRGVPLPEAVAAAKGFVRQAIERGQDVVLGAGAGPLIQTELRSKL